MIIYTDGSCLGNGKAVSSGGFGVVVVDKDENLVYTYSKLCKDNTTNNREELKAILYAFFNYGVKDNGDFVQVPVVYSDSAYCVNTFNEWMFNWARNGWINSSKKTPENIDLIQAYYDWYMRGYRIDLRKIKGHAGHEWNELADQLATGRISAEEAMRTYG